MQPIFFICRRKLACFECKPGSFSGRVPFQLIFRGNLQQRVPVDRRIIMRRLGRVRCRHSRQVEMLAGLRAHFRRVHQTVAAHPDAIISHRQVGNHVAPLIVGHNDLGELGGKLDALGDHPDAGFRPVRAGDDPADIVARRSRAPSPAARSPASACRSALRSTIRLCQRPRRCIKKIPSPSLFPPWL